jgi:hypothetical protein
MKALILVAENGGPNDVRTHRRQALRGGLSHDSFAVPVGNPNQPAGCSETGSPPPDQGFGACALTMRGRSVLELASLRFAEV